MTHCIRYMFSYLKQEYRVKEDLTPDKSFKKTFEKEKGNSNRSEFSKIANPNQAWPQSYKSNQVYIYIYDKVKAHPTGSQG